MVKKKVKARVGDFEITEDMGNTIPFPMTIEILIKELKKWPKDWGVVVRSSSYDKFHANPNAVYQTCSDAKTVSIWDRWSDSDCSEDYLYAQDARDRPLLPGNMVRSLRFLKSEIARMPGGMDEKRPYFNLLDILWEQLAEYYFRLDYNLPIKKPLSKTLIWHEWSRDKEKFLKDLPFLREKMKND